jgi:hypothetical protein
MKISRAEARKMLRVNQYVYAKTGSYVSQVGSIDNAGVWLRNSTTHIAWSEVDELHDYQIAFSL